MIPNGLLKQLEELETEMRERRVNHGRSESPTLVAWADRLSSIRAAVGGEAEPVAWQVWRNGKVSASLTRPPMSGEVAYEEGETVRALYASPTATVDVGALREAYIAGYRQGGYDHADSPLNTTVLTEDASSSANTDPALAALIAEAANAPSAGSIGEKA